MAESARLGKHEQPSLASIGGSGTTRTSSSLLYIAIDMRYGRCGCRPAHKARNCQYCGCKYEYDDQNDQPVLFEHLYSLWKSYILTNQKLAARSHFKKSCFIFSKHSIPVSP